ncbi:hypothetical protein ABPG72_010553 [Tetrahymena utriculariae]
MLKYQSSLSKILQQKLEIERQFSGQSQSEISSQDSCQDTLQEEMLKEIIFLAGSNKKLEREENREASHNNLENNIQDQTIIASIIFENNNQDLGQQGIKTKTKKNTFHLSNYTDQQKEKIVKRILATLDTQQKQVSSEKTRQGIHDI